MRQTLPVPGVPLIGFAQTSPPVKKGPPIGPTLTKEPTQLGSMGGAGAGIGPGQTFPQSVSALQRQKPATQLLEKQSALVWQRTPGWSASMTLHFQAPSCPMYPQPDTS